MTAHRLSERKRKEEEGRGRKERRGEEIKRREGKAGERAHQRPAATQPECMQEASRPERESLDQCRVDVPLELKEIDELPVGAIERQLVPGSAVVR